MTEDFESGEALDAKLVAGLLLGSAIDLKLNLKFSFKSMILAQFLEFHLALFYRKANFVL